MHSGTMFQNVSRQCFLKFHLFPWYSWLNPNFDTTPRCPRCNSWPSWCAEQSPHCSADGPSSRQWNPEGNRENCNPKGCILGVGIYFFFQSGACFLVICYILKQKPLLSWILELKFVICTVYRSFPSFTQFFHCFTYPKCWSSFA